MPATYTITMEAPDLMRVGFTAERADNDQIVRDAGATLEALIAAGQLPGGRLIRVNGPASLPVAMVIGHRLAHLYGAVAVYDPKLAGYVVALSHGASHAPGDVIAAD